MEIITSLILMASGVFLFYHAYYKPLIDYQKGVERLSELYKTQKKRLDIDLKKKEEATKAQDNTLNSVPRILKALNDTCRDSKVIIEKLEPSSDNPFEFTLHIITDYFKFIKILSEFEKLNITIKNIAIDEYETSLDNPKKTITLIVQVTGDVEKNKDKAKEILDKIVVNNSRNPFQTSELNEHGVAVRAINLTYIHQLSGMSLKKDNLSATIDNIVYHIGSKFRDKGVVEKIEKGKVRIFKKLENGMKQEYFIGIRRGKK
jgi:hypothetical protein